MFRELGRAAVGTFQAMTRGWLPLALLAAAGMSLDCGSKAATSTATLLPTDADFVACEGTPAVRFAPGVSVVSASGAYRATLETASTDQGGNTPVSTAAIGFDTFTISVNVVGDGGVASDAGLAAPDDLAMAAPPKTQAIPADPYMPLHGHGGSTIPAITAQGSGLYSVGDLDFFMGGYWELFLDLTPPGGTADLVTFPICIPDD
jgi:hypothetical protein